MDTRKYVAALACLALPVLAAARPPQVSVPSFPGLKSTAIDSVDITFGPLMLGVAGWLMDDHDEDSANLKKTIQGLKSVQIRHYEFKESFAYPKDDVDALRAQLSQPGWSQLVKVRNRDGKEDVDVYIALENQIVTGVTIIASGKREFTIVNVTGTVDLGQIDGIRKAFTSSDSQVAQALQRTP
jgi:Domain of unknown function (DUF4252)